MDTRALVDEIGKPQPGKQADVDDRADKQHDEVQANALSELERADPFPQPFTADLSPQPSDPRSSTTLHALSEGWSVRRASHQADLAFQRFYELRSVDESFAEAWIEAYEQGTQRLEDEATRRAVERYEEETRDADGNVIRSVRRFDSALLQQQLKARRPSVYRENAGLELNTPAVFIIDSAFGGDRGIEAPQVKPPLGLPRGDE